MAHRFFVGDKVETKRGPGEVRRVITWRDKIGDMTDAEAYEFCANCKLQVGLGFRDEWVELLVAIGRSLIRVQAKDVELLEGRDYGAWEGLKGFSSQSGRAIEEKD